MSTPPPANAGVLAEDGGVLPAPFKYLHPGWPVCRPHDPKVANMGHIDGAEVAKHDNKKSCWIVLDSNVYDVTNFISDHPGGAPIILRNAGTVCTGIIRSERVLIVFRTQRRSSRSITHWTT